MTKKFITKRLIILLSAIGMVSLSHQVSASGFQLWEQDGASVGNYHAGRAAIAEDASTAFYNPAGLVRIPTQQLVIAVDPITTAFLYDGTIAVELVDNNEPFATTAQGGTFNLVPSLNYAAPITPNLIFGLSVVAPFGLKTQYSRDSLVRYAATKTSLRVVDFSPSLGFAITDKLSIGLGVDIEQAQAEFDLVATAFGPELDTSAKNTFSGSGQGYHLGVLYQFTPRTRLGLAYQSQVNLRFRDGKSRFEGPLANAADGGIQKSNKLRTDTTLPATTTLSFFHHFNNPWDIMASVIYTQWSVFDRIVLNNVAGIENFEATNHLKVVIPENYHNTWNYALGANYHVNPFWFIRTGVGYDQTPSNNDDRNLQLPDNNRFVLAIGTHLQAFQTLGFDFGWSHFFTKETPIDVVQVIGDQVTTAKGVVNGNADVYGLQMTWDII